MATEQESRLPPESSRAALRTPFLGAQIVVLLAIALHVVLPNRLTLGPSWLLPSIEGVLVLSLMAGTPTLHNRHPLTRRRLALAMIGLVSADNAVSLALLVHYLLRGGHSSGRSLISSGALLWLTNVLLFGLWYWELDGGGPVVRPGGDDAPDFLFPQMATPELHQPGWRPGLIDFMYVSFTNATAFSPTDTMPLTSQAKILMSAQSLVSLVTIGLVVARAVNILT